MHRFGRGLWFSRLLVVTAMLAPLGSVRAAEEGNGVEKAKGLSRAFRAAAKAVIPTVVKIKTTTRAKEVPRGQMRGNPFQGTPFEDMFEEDGSGTPRRMPQRQGLGSGVIIDPSGIILTNEHVVEDADEVLVELADGTQFKGSDIKVDPQSDLAVLRIKAGKDLPAAKLGDSDTLDIGDWVLAIGTPFELDLTVSAGIISSKGRVLPSSRRANFLQTDAAINPGNSGGPLVNLDGEVIGINTAIASSSGSYEGVGFAIPSNLAKWVSDQLIENGTVERAYLGIGIAELNARLAEKLGVQRQKGVVVSDVFPNSPAAGAGLQEGDVITSFAGQSVSTPRQLQEIVERAVIGSKQPVTVIRDGKSATLTVTVKILPQNFGLAERSPRRPNAEKPPAPSFTADDLGIEVVDISDEMAKRLGTKAGVGVAISEISPGGLAASAGLRPGMLILRVGKKTVTSVNDFKAAVKVESLKEGIMLLVKTGEGNRFVVLQAP